MKANKTNDSFQQKDIESDSMDRLAQFFDLLLKIDQRNNPEAYGNKQNRIDTN